MTNPTDGASAAAPAPDATSDAAAADAAMPDVVAEEEQQQPSDTSDVVLNSNDDVEEAGNSNIIADDDGNSNQVEEDASHLTNPRPAKLRRTDLDSAPSSGDGLEALGDGLEALGGGGGEGGGIDINDNDHGDADGGGDGGGGGRAGSPNSADSSNPYYDEDADDEDDEDDLDDQIDIDGAKLKPIDLDGEPESMRGLAGLAGLAGTSAESAEGLLLASDAAASAAAAAAAAAQPPCSAAEFILRPPVTTREVESAVTQIRGTVDEALEKMKADGYAAYRRWASGHASGGGSNDPNDPNFGGDGGMDTDQEEEEERRRAEQSLEDAVVRGSPRRYQSDLFEIAKERNTIVNLGTGQGKTLIALLCIKHFAELDRAFEQGKQTLFLVPSIALAVQQSTTLRANLPYTVATACHTSTNSDRARDELRQANIVVATHGSAIDLLNHYADHLSFRNVNLLVIDECHYATGNHRYRTIMERFYRELPVHERPRVLGLTASLFVNVKKSHCSDDKLEEMLVQLERTLDSRLACYDPQVGLRTAALEDESDDTDADDCDVECGGEEGRKKKEGKDHGFVPKAAVERPVHYLRVVPPVSLPPYEHLALHESRFRELRQLTLLYDDLGPKVTAIYTKTLSREVSRNQYEQESSEEFTKFVAHLSEMSQFCSGLCEGCPNGGRTEKLAVLEELLENLIEREEAGRDAVGVVFVDRRVTAMALYDYFRDRNRALYGRREGQQQEKEGRQEQDKEDGSDGNGNHNNGMKGRASGSSTSWLRVGDTQWSRRITKRDIEKYCGGDESTGGVDPVRETLLDMLPEGYDIDLDNLDDFADAGATAGSNGIAVVEDDDHRGSATTASSADAVESKDAAAAAAKPAEIRCDVLVRNCTKVMKYLNQNYQRIVNHDEEDKRWLHQQRKIQGVLDGLRRRDTNVLIATSVVEEGVDVAACSFVIVLDTLKTTKAYVQMKGRARQKDAKFYVFENRHHDAPPVMTLEVAQEVERCVSTFIRSRENTLPPYVPPLARNRYTGASLNAELKALEEGMYRGKNGSVDLTCAKSLLNRYACAMPMDASMRQSRESLLLHLPHYDDLFLTLPAHLPSDIRCVSLPEKYWNESKRVKENVMALIAIVRLHSLDLLNDRLLPLRKRDMRNKLLSVALSELPSFNTPKQKAHPPVSGEPATAYVHHLKQSGSKFSQNDDALKGNGRSLCIITLKPLPGRLPTLRFNHAELDEIACEVGDPIPTPLTFSEWNVCAEFFSTLMNARFRRRNKPVWYRYNVEKARNSVFPPYIVGCLTKEGKLDWDRMHKVIADYERDEESKTAAVSALDGKSDLPEPRLWSPRYDPHITYIAFGPSDLDCSEDFPSQIDNVKSYQDYFAVRREHDVKPDCKLFAVQRKWHLPRRLKVLTSQNEGKHPRPPKKPNKKGNKKFPWEKDPEDYELQKGERAPCAGLTACLLPQDACIEAAVADATIVLHCILLPQVLFYVDRHLMLDAFIEYSKGNLPELGSQLSKIPKDDVMEAITAKSCLMDVNYDKLEWLGDGVLKLLHTDTLLHSRELRKFVGYLHEGDLSSLRQAMGSNERLRSAAKSTGIDKYILISQQGRGQWIPPSLEMYTIDEEGNEGVAAGEMIAPGNKTCADIMESLLGLVYLHSGYHASVAVANELGISLPRDPDIDVKTTKTPKSSLLALAKSVLDKQHFNHPELIEEALTHPSCSHEEVRSYQRLEWVGDAVLCLFARDYIYRNFPELDVAEQNTLEMTFVCNETLSYLNVFNGIHRMINHRDKELPRRFEDFQRHIGPYGRGLWSADPPKVLADVVESLIGAVHVDGGFDDGQKVAKRLLQPIINAVTDSVEGKDCIEARTKSRAFIHPKQVLHEFAGAIFSAKTWKEEEYATRKLRCPVWRGDSWGTANENGIGCIAVVSAFGVNVTSVAEMTATVAKNRACALAVSAFNKSPELVDKLMEVQQYMRPDADSDDDENEELEQACG